MTPNADFHTRVNGYEAARPAPYSLPAAPQSLYVEMRDGCRIAVDVYVPQGAEPDTRFPTLLLFTPYFRRFALAAGSTAIPNPNTGKFSDYFVPRGYVVVVIDVRGTGASFGTRDGFRSPQERLDSAEIADWAIAQPWSNGLLGATGISYLGAASDFLASTGHPAVKAIAPLFSVWDTYADNYFPGGMQCMSLTQLYDKLMMGLDLDRRECLKDYSYYANPDYQGPQPVDDDYDGALVAAAVAEHQGNFRQTDFMADLRYREDGLPYDPTYSSASISPYHYATGMREDVAILSMSGWMDGAGYANGAIARFLTRTNNPRHLVLGPWDHGARIDVSPWRQSETPRLSVLGCVLRFFDTYLLDANTGLRDEPAVAYYKLHEEAWGEAESWPPRPHTAIFHAAPDGQLAATAQAGTVTYQVTPHIGTGTQTRYERISGLDSRDYYHDWQGRTEAMLSWDSAPLTAPMTFAGHALLDLTASFDTPDAGLFVYLTEVEADGRERYVTEGILRALFRQTTEAPATIRITWPFRTFHRASARPLPFNEPQQIKIPLLPTAWTFSAGSRLRLSIAGADKDHFLKVPHGKPPCIQVDLAHTRLHLPLDQETLPNEAEQPLLRPTFDSLLSTIKAQAPVVHMTALRYGDDAATRLYSSAPAIFSDQGSKRFADAPLMETVRSSWAPVLSDGEAALKRGFADWQAIVATGCQAVLNIPVRDSNGIALGQVNLLAEKGTFSPATIDRLAAVAGQFRGLFATPNQKEFP